MSEQLHAQAIQIMSRLARYLIGDCLPAPCIENSFGQSDLFTVDVISTHTRTHTRAHTHTNQNIFTLRGTRKWHYKQNNDNEANEVTRKSRACSKRWSNSWLSVKVRYVMRSPCRQRFTSFSSAFSKGVKCFQARCHRILPLRPS
jgi:hypothetical protein